MIFFQHIKMPIVNREVHVLKNRDVIPRNHRDCRVYYVENFIPLDWDVGTSTVKVDNDDASVLNFVTPPTITELITKLNLLVSDYNIDFTIDSNTGLVEITNNDVVDHQVDLSTGIARRLGFTTLKFMISMNHTAESYYRPITDTNPIISLSLNGMAVDTYSEFRPYYKQLYNVYIPNTDDIRVKAEIVTSSFTEEFYGDFKIVLCYVENTPVVNFRTCELITPGQLMKISSHKHFTILQCHQLNDKNKTDELYGFKFIPYTITNQHNWITTPPLHQYTPKLSYAILIGKR